MTSGARASRHDVFRPDTKGHSLVRVTVPLGSCPVRSPPGGALDTEGAITASCRPSPRPSWQLSLRSSSPCVIPPFVVGYAVSSPASQRRGRPARRPALSVLALLCFIAGCLNPPGDPCLQRDGADRSNSRRAGDQQQKKRGCHISTPPDRQRLLALLPALFRAALLCSLLRHYSSLECGSSAK
jgi:hypothetical protein